MNTPFQRFHPVEPACDARRDRELLVDVLNGSINPGRVFDVVLPLSEVAEAYAAMDERRATKVLLRA